MIDLIKDMLKSPAGSFGFIFALLVLAFFLTYWITKQITKWETKLSHVDKLDSNITIIKEDMAIIKAFITVYNEMNNPFAKKNSPIQLTPKGEQVSKDLDINKILALHWNEIETDIEKALKQDYNPYDIQQEAIVIASKIQDYLTNEEIEKMKIYAFKHGHNLTTYNLLIGVHIRDIYFKKHNINIEDVDKHGPLRKTQTEQPV